MKIATALVIDGRIDVPDDFLVEGTSVMVLAVGAQEPVRLTLDQERELLEAADEIRRGDSIDGAELLAELRALALK